MDERDPDREPDEGQPPADHPPAEAAEVDEGDDVTSAEETADRADVGHS